MDKRVLSRETLDADAFASDEVPGSVVIYIENLETRLTPDLARKFASMLIEGARAADVLRRKRA